MEKILQDIGLSKNESKAYLALLKFGKMRLKEITDVTRLHRQNALDSLDRLHGRGLISVVLEGKRKTYSAVNPDRLRVIIEEKGKRLEQMLPTLLSLVESKDKPRIDIFNGPEGLKTILNDEISTGQTMHVIQSSHTVEALAGSYLSISRERRSRAGIAMKIIYSKDDRQSAEQARSYPNTELKYSDEDFGSTTIDVYGDRTVLIFGQAPTIIRITDREVARRFLGFFEMNWKNIKAKRVGGGRLKVPARTPAIRC